MSTEATEKPKNLSKGRRTKTALAFGLRIHKRVRARFVFMWGAGLMDLRWQQNNDERGKNHDRFAIPTRPV